MRIFKGSVYFDMDGTIADLYNVPEWLPKLRECDPTPYLSAAPLVDMSLLIDLLNELRAAGYRIGIVSWLSKGSTLEYDRAVRSAKSLWLYGMCGRFSFDEIHFIKYGTPKHRAVKDKTGWLVDDSLEVLEKWKGRKINAKEQNILDELRRLL